LTARRGLERKAMAQPDKPVISVVVPNYNGATFLAECLDSLLEQSVGDVEIVLVDNASSDSSVEMVEQKYPRVELVRMNDNRGFAAAVNAGIEKSGGEFVVLLNNDTRADPDFLAELHAALESESKAAMAAPKMLFARDPSVINSLGLGYCISGTNHDIGFGRKDGPEFDRREWIFGPCGGAGMYRRGMLEEVGPFDEDFFMYYEDVDFCFRAQLSGHKSISVPSARVYHIEGASGKSLPRPRNYYFARNALAVIIKNFPGRLLIRNAHVLIWEMAKRAGSPMLGGDFSALWGYLAGLWSIRDALRKRKAIQESRKVPDDYIEDFLARNRSILKEIDLRGRPAEELP